MLLVVEEDKEELVAELQHHQIIMDSMVVVDHMTTDHQHLFLAISGQIGAAIHLVAVVPQTQMVAEAALVEWEDLEVEVEQVMADGVIYQP